MSDLDLTGKRCPCPTGWHCDPATDACVLGEQQATDGGAERVDAAEDGLDSSEDGLPLADGPVDAAGHDLDAAVEDVDTDTMQDSDVDAGPPAVVVDNLRVDWVTPRWIHWQWDLAGDPDGLLGFELVTATSEQDVLNRTGSAVVWTAEENPELGRFYLPATGGEDPVIYTLTHDHEPGRDHFAQLTAIDTAGRRSVTNVATARTQDAPSHAVVVFSETDIGWPMPSTVELSDRFPYEGTYHYDYLNHCSEGEPACYQNVGRQGFSISLSDIGQESFDTAYFELAVAVEGSVISYWSQILMAMDDVPDGPNTAYVYDRWTINPTGQYVVYQVPLRVFKQYKHLEAGLEPNAVLDPLDDFRVGGLWADGAHVSLDEIRVCW